METRNRSQTDLSPTPDWQYGVYTLNSSTQGGLTVSRYFIVLKKNELIQSFTRLEEFSRRGGKPVHYYSSASRTPLVFITEFLNFLIRNYPDVPAQQIPWSFSPEDLQDFFWLYSSRELQEDTIKKCLYCVTDFAAGLAAAFPDNTSYEKEDLFEEHVHTYERGRVRVHRKILFTVSTPGKASMPFRDIPSKALALLIRLAWVHTPDIAFAICAQAFTGLREGEVLSMRQMGSCFGPSLEFTYPDSEMPSAVDINVNTEYTLREDMVQPAHIKIRRKAHVYPAYISVFMYALENHMQFLKNRQYDRKRAPMFIDRYGRAMSYATYRNRFKALVDTYFRPALLHSTDSELRIYGQLLISHSLTLHSLRHAFSQALVLFGEPLEVLMDYRGDHSP